MEFFIINLQLKQEAIHNVSAFFNGGTSCKPAPAGIMGLITFRPRAVRIQNRRAVALSYSNSHT